MVRHSTLRLLIALSAQLGLEILHLDVNTAFLNGLLKEQVFMYPPVGLESCDKNKVLKLKRAIYGLKQSSRVWYERVYSVLTDLEYKQSEAEPCLFEKKDGDSITIVTLYVDDFFIFSNNQQEMSFLKHKLGEQFKIKDLGRARNILGMKLDFDRKNNVITVSQEEYIDKLLVKFKMEECKPVKTPIEMKLDHLYTEGGKQIDVPYQNLIGSLMYLAVLTRPDISFSISLLSQFNNCYSEVHWQCAKRVLRYLKGTKSYCLKFCKDDINLEGFADADWANNLKDRKSYTGYVFKLCGSVISWASAKQRTVALSSTEAEYMAISEACQEAIYLRNLMFELTGKTLCVALYNDNQSALSLSSNSVHHSRTKHIDVRYHFVREAINNDFINVNYMSTDLMIADILTKGVCPVKHHELLNNLGIQQK